MAGIKKVIKKVLAKGKGKTAAVKKPAGKAVAKIKKKSIVDAKF